MSKRFTKQQPKDGETVLHCGHLEIKPHHFFAFGDGTNTARFSFRRPDGTLGEATWMVLCGRCFSLHGDCPERAMRADVTWLGDEPAIEESIQ